ncbi:DNA polymerase I [Mesoterricola silvestris]|uniref:DNA polymerase I n=1 Tax=Mesoterricola silvestris TaxID=2927979 RepID=A0AA48GP38_9BACT|nr:DNA polymerase I [Mesoterricola silvestris]BDU73499.1 DNA polymerase I [Mesoterricola silvestris]
MSEDRLYLIDAFALIFRAYYGNLRMKNGAALTMARMLLALVAQHKPTHIAAVFDRPEPTFRHEIYPEYKANRAEMPEDLRPQVPLIRDLIRALNIPIVELAGFEADDVMGTLARQACAAGLPSVIVSPDKDLLQLVSDEGRIQVLNNRDGEVWIDRAGVKERFGVWPEQVVDVLSLMGDASDNVKGVEGIGEKGARDLVEQFGNLDAIVAHRAELKRKAHREGLEAALPRLELVRRLVTVVTDLELPVTLEDLAYKGVDQAQARAAFKALGFEQLTKEFTEVGSAAAPSAARAYRAAATRADLVEAVARCREAGLFGLDTETTSIDPTRGHIVGLSLAWKPNEGLYVPLAHLRPGSEDTAGSLPGLLPDSGLPEGLLDLRGEPGAFFRELAPYLDPRNIPFDEAREVLGPLFLDAAVGKAGQNLKYDLQVLKRHGMPVRGLAEDSMVLSFLVDSRLRHNLDDLSSRHLDLRPIPFEAVVGKGKAAKRFDEAEFEKAVQYAAEDADLALQLCGKLQPLLPPDLRRLYAQVDLPLVEALADLELEGVRLDVDVLEHLAKAMRVTRDGAADRAFELAGEAFNLNSPAQLGRILYEKLNLPVLKRTDKTKAPATDEDVLTELAQREDGEIARVLLRHRQMQKLLSTYVEALPAMVSPVTGRLHTRLHQAAVATGRLASSDPNLQNIPVRTEDGRAIRGAFVPREGWVFLDADYSQIELRVVAALAGDPVLLGAFGRGEDIHRRTASEVLGVDMEAVTGEQRSAAKAVNFGLLYGQGAYALSASLGISFKEAKAFIERYFERMPKVAEWIEATKARAVEEGLVRTLWGRVRRIPDLQSPNQGLKAQALREAVNTVVQGTAADLMRRAMVRLHRSLEAGGFQSRLLLQVHDELLVEAPPAEAEAVAALLKDAMEGADDLGPLGVKLAAEVRRGNSWLECK